MSNQMSMLLLCIRVYSWYPLSPRTYHNSASGGGYSEFSAAWLDSTTGCHRIYSALERRDR